jgi:transformation/transcription domain-associated protein
MNVPDDDGMVLPMTMATLKKMASNLPSFARVCNHHVTCSYSNTAPEQKEYEEDFLKTPLTHYEYLRRLQNWRDRYERLLDSKPREQSLDLLSHYLVDFQYTRFDDIEIPGQYLEVRNINHVIRRQD